MPTSKGTTDSKKTSRPAKAKSSASAASKTASKTAKSAPSRASAAPPKRVKAVTASAVSKRKAAPTRNVITSEERQRMIDEAAYYIAEKRGFAGGDPQQDWMDAAAQIDRMIMETNSSKN